MQSFRTILLLGLFVAGLATALVWWGQPTQNEGWTVSGSDFDTGYDPVAYARVLSRYSGDQVSKGWVRLREIGEDSPRASLATWANSPNVRASRYAILRIHGLGQHTVVLIRRSEPRIGNGPNADHYWPADLRDVYARGCRLGEIYGDVADAWEIDNEPDLGFVPEAAENYAAFLKAFSLGLKAGMNAGLLDGSSPLLGSVTNNRERIANSPRAPLVLMGALGLPPGPWLERFVQNDGLSYTDGYNFHYYGYADDFMSVDRAHESAVARLSDERYQLLGAKTNNQEPNASNHWQRKELPIFLTEIGYGMLGKSARDTKEGRLRQWRWFKSVGEQVARLRPEASMAFLLQPYLEYDTLEFGLTVPQRTVKLSDGSSLLLGKRDSWTAGGITYAASDFSDTTAGVQAPVTSNQKPIAGGSAASWMNLIGQKIGGDEITPALAWWFAAPRGAGVLVNRDWLSGSNPNNQEPITDNRSRSWVVTTAAPSPIVIDFIPGEGLLPLKRYLGSFVAGTAKSLELGARSRESTGSKSAANNQQRSSDNPPPRGEEFTIHVRTQNGNLYEVYPTRQATSSWQTYLEQHDNFTMSFYGRAQLPWRFSDNKPMSLVLVLYPKALPAVYEFRWVQLLELGAGSKEQGDGGRTTGDGGQKTEDSGQRTALEVGQNNNHPVTNNRFGRGRIILYNFSDKPISGRLVLPDRVGRVVPNAPATDSADTAPFPLTLQPNERREVEVEVHVGAERFERMDAPVVFEPDNPATPPARFQTQFFPDVAGMKASVVGDLVPKLGAGSREQGAAGRNTELIRIRPRAVEEAPKTEQGARSVLQTSGLYRGVFVQQGASVEKTPDGFSVSVTARPPGKEQRVEVEIPWPDGMGFPSRAFLSLEYRLKSVDIPTDKP